MIRWPLAWRSTVDRLEVELAAVLSAAVEAVEAAGLARAEAHALQARLADRTGAAELARAHKTLLRYDNLLAAYEGRPTPYCRRCEPQHTPTGALL